MNGDTPKVIAFAPFNRFRVASRVFHPRYTQMPLFWYSKGYELEMYWVPRETLSLPQPLGLYYAP